MFEKIKETAKKYLAYIGIGILAIFAAVVAIASVVFNIKKEIEQAKPKPTEPAKPVNDITIDYKEQKDNSPEHTADKATEDSLKKLFTVLLFVGLFNIAHPATNSLEKEYDAVYKKIEGKVLTDAEKNNLATRYAVMSKYNASSIEYPSMQIVIYNNNTHKVISTNNKMVVYYDYGNGKSDTYTYTLEPEVKITYTNTDAPIDLKKHFYVGFGIGYSPFATNPSPVSYCMVGYTAFSWMGLSLVPSIGFSLPDKIDIIPNITYNLFDYCDVGLGCTILKFGVVFTIGKNF